MDNSTFLKQVSYIVNIDTYNRIDILGGVNLQEIFLTNDMIPITCDNILQ